jgi:hypothetical protein
MIFWMPIEIPYQTGVNLNYPDPQQSNVKAVLAKQKKSTNKQIPAWKR